MFERVQRDFSYARLVLDVYEAIDLYSDSARGRDKGFGIYLKENELMLNWSSDWEHKGLLSEFKLLELICLVCLGQST